MLPFLYINFNLFESNFYLFDFMLLTPNLFIAKWKDADILILNNFWLTFTANGWIVDGMKIFFLYSSELYSTNRIVKDESTMRKISPSVGF